MVLFFKGKFCVISMACVLNNTVAFISAMKIFHFYKHVEPCT